jgi:hypothetical protein
MASFRAILALLVFMTGVCCSAAIADEAAPGKQSDNTPELRIAASVAKKIDKDDASWQELTLKLQKAVEQYNPASVRLLPESQSLEAFRNYCGKLLESGKNLVALHEKWNQASEGLGDSLRKAPAYYRSAAKAMREKAETMRFEVIKERYLLTADIWEQLAVRAEKRAKELSLDTGSRGVVDVIREENTFLSDFISTLDALPRVSGEDGGRYRDLIEVLRKHAAQSDELYRQLKLFRDKLKTEPREATPSK